MIQKKFSVFQFGNQIVKQAYSIPTNNVLSEFTQDSLPTFNSESIVESKPKEPWECRFEERPPDPRSNPYPCGIPNPAEYICNPCGLPLNNPNRPASCPSPSNPDGIDPCCSPQFTTKEQKESCCCQKKDPKTWIPLPSEDSCGDCGIKLYPAYPNEADENGIGSSSDFSGRIGFYAPIRNVVVNPNTGQFERDSSGNLIPIGQGKLMPKI